tara:strand:- start:712 stop:999 length:288 start_codon:yes stop_codon:yes gene_type:complete
MKIKKNQIKIILFLLLGIFLVNIDLQKEDMGATIIEYPNKVVIDSEGEQYIDQRYKVGNNEICISDCKVLSNNNDFKYHSAIVRKWGQCHCRYII